MRILAIGAIMMMVLGALALLGITGRWDYEDARRIECAQRYSQAYDPSNDKCVNPQKEN